MMHRLYLAENEITGSDEARLHRYVAELSNYSPHIIAVDMVYSKLYAEVCWDHGHLFLGLRSAKGSWFAARDISQEYAVAALLDAEAIREGLEVLEQNALRGFEENLLPRRRLFEEEHDPKMDRINRWFLRRAWADYISNETAKVRANQNLEFEPFEKYYLSPAAFSFLGDWS